MIWRIRRASARSAQSKTLVGTGLIVVVMVLGGRIARADSAEVEALIEQGNELRRQGHPDRALPLFQKAYGLSHTPRTEAQLGLAEMSAGEPVEAERHLGSALESPEFPWIAKNRAGLEKVLAAARAQIAEIVIDGGPPGAAVTVNGRPAGAFPQVVPIRVAPGRIEIEISASGYTTATRLLHVGRGEHQRLMVELEKIPLTASPSVVAAVPTPTVSTAPPTVLPAATAPTSTAIAPAAATPQIVTVGAVDRRETSGLRIAAWVVGAGALVAVGAGVGLQLAARSKNSDFSSSCYLKDGNPIVAPMSSLTNKDCSNLYDGWSSEKRWSIGGYVAGAALAATSGFLFWSSGPTAAAGDVRAQVQCAPGLGAVFCQGQF